MGVRAAERAGLEGRAGRAGRRSTAVPAVRLAAPPDAGYRPGRRAAGS